MIFLSQSEAERLIQMQKVRADVVSREFPSLGGKVTAPLISLDNKEDFSLDIWQSKFVLSKVGNQLRGRKVIPLVRIDVNGAPHRNPDGEEISGAHIHLFREGFADKWAQPLPSEAFTDTTNPQRVFNDFLRYCNVTVEPIFTYNLFA